MSVVKFRNAVGEPWQDIQTVNVDQTAPAPAQAEKKAFPVNEKLVHQVDNVILSTYPGQDEKQSPTYYMADNAFSLDKPTRIEYKVGEEWFNLPYVNCEVYNNLDNSRILTPTLDFCPIAHIMFILQSDNIKTTMKLYVKKDKYLSAIKVYQADKVEYLPLETKAIPVRGLTIDKDGTVVNPILDDYNIKPNIIVDKTVQYKPWRNNPLCNVIVGNGNTFSTSDKVINYVVCLGSNNVLNEESYVIGSNNQYGRFGNHIFGDSNTGGNDAYLFGLGLKANYYSQRQLLLGKFNDTSAEEVVFGIGTDEATPKNGMTLDSVGNLTTLGVVTNGGADYTEYFEWQDGNPGNEDRIGLLVALDNGKIRKAKANDNILGAISATACMIGDNAEWSWKRKYLTDKFGRIQYKTIQDEEGNDIQVEVINPEYDETKVYIPRKDRPEWATVGLLGKLIIIDDGKAKPNDFITASSDGIATVSNSPTNIQVLERIDNNTIKVFFK